ncbi:DUF624 domain-containing protein [Alkalihalophilus lindianensis]|uniref:DUF624 domain-containing protein n=1 Tax=Alkalihalophilus lindianensis TaxID=1630542 RepID=A0ABU3XCK8_9BACI|nr:DUF624 domain-containing protein [Alkalihalophilus lindianensis]MDV2685628.1 DUF624 domain-containing protein [Alkalihalophilus lindianensis]
MMKKIDLLFRLISKFALLNLLWIGFSILGLGVIGFFPATVAMFSISRKWVRGEEDITVFSGFWSEYKRMFVKSNIFGWIVALIGFLLYINYQVIISLGTETPFIVVLSYIFVVLMYIMFVVTLVPVAVHFEGGTLAILKKTFQFMVGRVHIALLFILLIWASVYMSLAFPTAILFFSGSVLSYMVMWFFTNSLKRIETKQVKVKASFS